MATQTDMHQTVIGVLQETTRDWDMDLPEGIGAHTTLIEDLEFESIDMVQFAVALEQALGRRGLPFEKLFIKDGNYVDDVTVEQVVQFLCSELEAT